VLYLNQRTCLDCFDLLGLPRYKGIRYTHLSFDQSNSTFSSSASFNNMTSSFMDPRSPSSVPTLSSPISSTGVSISLPDTPASRQLLETWERQRQRRVSTQHILFNGPSNTSSSPSTSFVAHRSHAVPPPGSYSQTPTSTSPISFPPTVLHSISSDLNGPNNTSSSPSTSFVAHRSDSFPLPTIKFPPSTPPFPQRPHDTIDVSIASEPHEISEPAVFNQHITSQILSGSSVSQRTTSRQAFNSCLSSTGISSAVVFEAKKNRSASSNPTKVSSSNPTKVSSSNSTNDSSSNPTNDSSSNPTNDSISNPTKVFSSNPTNDSSFNPTNAQVHIIAPVYNTIIAPDSSPIIAPDFSPMIRSISSFPISMPIPSFRVPVTIQAYNYSPDFSKQISDFSKHNPDLIKCNRDFNKRGPDFQQAQPELLRFDSMNLLCSCMGGS